ncbi:hypothetical protein [Pseudomonas vanderleydeniana]|uniref:Uncharacterized protein n=1 Tax=Pseudomonas vanderleydeniana TaxID=2745495 RepID=A0A9E6PH16_9PSED|nr:hypothetical protein [Pseudomonas vanderleydeniana]QXI26282.1 hypothetical protein HU752_020270 [Pseudomonas vanderleydeniana]
MTTTSTNFLNLKLGKSTIGENLLIARERGDVILHEDATWELKRPARLAENWVFGPNRTPFPCGKLLGFLFRQAYAQAAVPVGCRHCYKVQVHPTSLEQLIATQKIAHDLPYAYKAGASLNARYQAGPYRALFYLDGLQSAREAYQRVREHVLATPELGAGVSLSIKRGCTEYEVHCGPSNEFTFSDDLAAAERELLQRLRQPATPKARQPALTMMTWVQIAYQLGDESYKKFTQGRALYPEPVSYLATP